MFNFTTGGHRLPQSLRNFFGLILIGSLSISLPAHPGPLRCEEAFKSTGAGVVLSDEEIVAKLGQLRFKLPSSLPLSKTLKVAENIWKSYQKDQLSFHERFLNRFKSSNRLDEETSVRWINFKLETMFVDSVQKSRQSKLANLAELFRSNRSYLKASLLAGLNILSIYHLGVIAIPKLPKIEILRNQKIADEVFRDLENQPPEVAFQMIRAHLQKTARRQAYYNRAMFVVNSLVWMSLIFFISKNQERIFWVARLMESILLNEKVEISKEEMRESMLQSWIEALKDFEDRAPTKEEIDLRREELKEEVPD